MKPNLCTWHNFYQ